MPFQFVSCPCGTEVRVDPMKGDRRVICPNCNSPLDFIVAMDAKLKKPRVSIIIPMGLMKTEGASLGSAPASPPPPAEPVPVEPAPAAPPSTRGVRRGSGKTIRGIIATCECGGTFPVNEEELTTVQSCPKCKVSYHVVVKRDEDKRKSAILVPVKPVGKNAGANKTMISKPVPGQTAAKARTQKVPAVAPKEKAGQTVAKKPKAGVTKYFTIAPSGPPPEVPPGAQAVACTCGEYLIVRRRDVEKGMTCETCDRKAEFVMVRDPQSLAPIIKLKT